MTVVFQTSDIIMSDHRYTSETITYNCCKPYGVDEYSFEHKQYQEYTPDYASEQAKRACEIIRSIRSRHARLEAFMRDCNFYKTNPLGGPMCTQLEEKINQLALLIHSQQKELKQIIEEYELATTIVPCNDTPNSSLADWEEAQSQASAPTHTDEDESEPEEEDSPIFNNNDWLKISRVVVLRDVVEFFSIDLVQIESSPLLTRFSPKKTSSASLLHIPPKQQPPQLPLPLHL